MRSMYKKINFNLTFFNCKSSPPPRYLAIEDFYGPIELSLIFSQTIQEMNELYLTKVFSKEITISNKIGAKRVRDELEYVC